VREGVGTQSKQKVIADFLNLHFETAILKTVLSLA